MNIHEMRHELGYTQSEFAARYHIPFRSIQNWETGKRSAPDYLTELLEARVKADLANRKTIALPEYDPNKKDLPKRSDYIGSIAWLKAVRDCIAEPFVFALDDALMCQGSFSGRSDEFIVWVYGDDSLSHYNGIVVLGNKVSSYNVCEKNGLHYTDFNRTLADALANENILDMQGITEALSRYYYTHENSFQGISAVPEYQDAFERLAEDAVDYYNS